MNKLKLLAVAYLAWYIFFQSGRLDSFQRHDLVWENYVYSAYSQEVLGQISSREYNVGIFYRSQPYLPKQYIFYGSYHHREAFWSIEAGHKKNTPSSGMLLSSRSYHKNGWSKPLDRPLGYSLVLNSAAFLKNNQRFNVQYQNYYLNEISFDNSNDQWELRKASLDFSAGYGIKFFAGGYQIFHSNETSDEVYFSKAYTGMSYRYKTNLLTINSRFIMNSNADYLATLYTDFQYRNIQYYFKAAYFHNKEVNPFALGVLQQYEKGAWTSGRFSGKKSEGFYYYENSRGEEKEIQKTTQDYTEDESVFSQSHFLLAGISYKWLGFSAYSQNERARYFGFFVRKRKPVSLLSDQKWNHLFSPYFSVLNDFNSDNYMLSVGMQAGKEIILLADFFGHEEGKSDSESIPRFYSGLNKNPMARRHDRVKVSPNITTALGIFIRFERFSLRSNLFFKEMFQYPVDASVFAYFSLPLY